MKDKFGREIKYARFSLTERCTLRCVYCRANEGVCLKQQELTTDEWVRIAEAMDSLGIHKIRLTGGEPLLRKDIIEIVRRICAIPNIEEVALTTNGQKLHEMAADLKAAGLSRVNISLDSLNPEKYHEMTGGGSLSAVLKSIDTALALDLAPLKINAVLVRGVNDDEVDEFIHLAKDRPIDMRFIELMPMAELGQDANMRIPSDELIAARPYLMPIPPRYPGQPSADYAIAGYQGRIGFISPVGHKFCASCNRIRVMSDGKLRLCLGRNTEVALKEALKQDDETLKRTIEKAIYDKPIGHNFEEGFVSDRDMSRIGG